MEYQIIENFLEKELFYKVKKSCFEEKCQDNLNWFRNNVVKPEDENFYFCHLAFHEYNMSPIFPIMKPILNKLNVKSLKRIKLNFYPSTEKIIKHEEHEDYPFSHKGALLSLNTCDGGTYLNDNFVNSVENKVLLFNPSQKHSSTTTTKKEGRANISFNYF